MKVCLQYTFCVLLAMSSLLTSCVQEVTLDADEKPAVVVECVLKNSDVQKLRLNFTKGPSEDEADPLTEAIGEFKKSTGNLWTLDYTPVSAHHYRLEVQVPGYDLIWAELMTQK